MLMIDAGYRQVWPTFALDVVNKLSFAQGSDYQLQGSNGSGKSSFLHKLLLPAIRQSQAGYIIFLQQQMYLQLFALKAHAAFHSPGFRISDANDAAQYLLQDLRAAYAKQAQDIYLIADESPALDLLIELELPHCLILIDHHRQLPDARIVSFDPQSSQLSKVSTDV